MRPSVCFVSPSPASAQLLLSGHGTKVGGAEVQIAHLASALARRGHAVTCIVAAGAGAVATTRADGVRVIPAYAPERRGGVAGWLGVKWPKLWRALREADADVYLTRGMNWHAGAVALFARRHRRRCAFWMAAEDDVLVLAQGNGLPAHIGACYRYGIRAADAIIAQTQRQRELMREIAGRDCTVIPNMWVGPSDTSDDPEPVQPMDVLWVGNIRPRKRPELALAVARRLPELRFAIVGGPAAGCEELWRQVEESAMGLANVSLIGAVPRQRVHAYYRASRILLHTSHSEGFPNVFLEAWGHGLPVVSTFDPDGIIACYDLGRVGESAEELARGIADLTGDHTSYARASANAAQYVRRHHDPETIVETLGDLLTELVAARFEAGGGSP
ncbi:MAG: glycosyltransferase family 4 protein [Armatimonadota bacterium]